MAEGKLHIGTCSWKYPSWEGLVYSSKEPANFLEEYAKKYKTVEVDQWFYSLGKSETSLPKPETVAEYDGATPSDFKFTIKCPNAITMPYHKSKAGSPLEANALFLDVDFFKTFLDSVAQLLPKIGLFIIQFEYMNQDKMPSKAQFFDRLALFLESLPKELPYAVELRNPRWVDSSFFSLLSKANAAPVLLQGYWMEDIAEMLRKYQSKIGKRLCIRLHGEDREGMDEKSGTEWGKIIRNKDEEISRILEVVVPMLGGGTEIFLNVNNHFEGSAPLMIEKILRMIPE